MVLAHTESGASSWWCWQDRYARGRDQGRDDGRCGLRAERVGGWRCGGRSDWALRMKQRLDGLLGRVMMDESVREESGLGEDDVDMAPC